MISETSQEEVQAALPGQNFTTVLRGLELSPDPGIGHRLLSPERDP